MTAYRQPFSGEWLISQGYGETYTSSFHTGIDYACPLGTGVLASADGSVVYARWDNFGYGNCVIIEHEPSKATLYAHLQTIGVTVGQKVKQGDVVGLSGSTGNSTGPHLHFEARSVWYDYKTHKDPVTFLPLMSVDDNAHSYTEQPEEHPDISEGICKIVCSVAWIRDWQNIERSYTVNEGTEVYVFPDVKYRDGLPYRYIGADRCIAEYDQYGTQIIARAE